MFCSRQLRLGTSLCLFQLGRGSVAWGSNPAQAKNKTGKRMRPAGKGPLDSLYFDYPIFAARHVAELDGVAAPHPVVIVGRLQRLQVIPWRTTLLKNAPNVIPYLQAWQRL